MDIYQKLIERKETLCVIGLGYVGMPIAVSFSHHINVIGFDINTSKIELYKSGIDPTNEVGNDAVRNSQVHFTSDENDIKKAKFHIIAVPTPINQDKTPDLHPVESSSRIVGRNLTKGSIVVYESTVYPGVTEDICIPILENESGLKNGIDFKVGYSPERINPGDKVHTLDKIVKIVSGQDSDSCDQIALVYGLVIAAGTHKVTSIKVAEAAKVVENSQRDINIAFMNELAMVFDLMKIDTKEVITAMNTKWNALGFTPGLVGGHCIGVDPYYFIYQAEKLGYHSQIILAGRKINDGIGKFIASNIIRKLIETDNIVRKAKVSIFGFTFKENCPDTRNTKVYDIIQELNTYGIFPVVVDPRADKSEVFHEYGIKLGTMDDAFDSDVIVIAVAHKEYKEISLSELSKYYNKNRSSKILIDVKSIYDIESLLQNDFSYWRL